MKKHQYKDIWIPFLFYAQEDFNINDKILLYQLLNSKITWKKKIVQTFKELMV